MEEFIIQEIIKKTIAQSIAIFSNKKNSSSKSNEPPELVIEFKEHEKALKNHLSEIRNWSDVISIFDRETSSASFSSRYIPQTYSLLSSPDNDYALEDVIARHEPSVILGPPGAGKTTTVKNICSILLGSKTDIAPDINFPILVRFRDLDKDESLASAIIRLLGIQLHYPNAETAQQGKIEKALEEIKRFFVYEYLNAQKCCVLLDGLDEIEISRSEVYQSELRLLFQNVGLSKIIVTCRTGAISIKTEHAESFLVNMFSTEQISSYVYNWFRNGKLAQTFLKEVQASPFSDTVGRPLTLGNLCMVFERYEELPSPPNVIYQKIVQLLLEDWDRQRKIRRTSAYASFGPDRKKLFLAAIAYGLAREGHSAGFEHGDLRRVFRQVHERFGLPQDSREQVLNEIESHTGLLMSKGFQGFEFSHKSLQEFLAAEHISRHQDLVSEMDYLKELPNECAISIGLSASPNRVLELLVADSRMRYDMKDRGHAGNMVNFWKQFFTRVMIEKANFERTKSLGANIFSLLSMLWVVGDEKPVVKRLKGSEQLEEVISDVLNNTNLQRSFDMCKEDFVIVGTGNKTVELKLKDYRKNQFKFNFQDRFVVSSRFAAGISN